MYESVKHTKNFDPGKVEDMEEYNKILNDPCSVVLEERTLTKTTREFNSEGDGMSEKIDYMVITWEEREIY